MKRVMLFVVLLIPMCVAGIGAAAQQAPDTDEEETKTAEAQQADERTAEPAEGKPAEGRRDKEIFIPSEEISEDFAVSFPVDI